MHLSRIFLPSTCIAYLLFAASCQSDSSLFKKINSSQSGIHFKNEIIENDTLNPLDITNIYNGGGVGVGDFDHNGLQDIYFTGNTVENKLYLNKGDFKFQDITKEAGVTGEGRWSRGVAVVDINNDGWLDLYVCTTILKDVRRRQNLLYVNQGLDKSGIPIFKDMAAEYGLDDTTYSTMAAFFDYDNDGDLDMYLAVNDILKEDNPSVYRAKITDGTHPSTGRLYRNDWKNDLKHAYFTNVSKEAGVIMEGYAHAVTISDFNRDGWKDIFVTNDFNSDDLLYINNHDGTFTDKAATYFKHTSANGMGQDVIDINNDGLSDVIELDMNPEDNFRKKMMMGPNSYQIYQNFDFYGYNYQYVRNTLQLNQGPTIHQNDSIGDPVFTDIAFYSGIAETDWSWTPLVQDFDGDGYRDIVITNGFPRDITDRDFISFRNQSSQIASKDYMLSQMPQVKLHNYAYRNKGDCTFSNESMNWGLKTPSFSSGAAYADLDNDGDMDMVINNINDEAFLYRNSQIENNENLQFLDIHLEGDSLNRFGFGAWIELYYERNMQVYEQSPYRGYLSTIQIDPHFGLGNTKLIDSVIVKWPNRKKQVLPKVATNQKLKINIRDAQIPYDWQESPLASKPLFTEVTNSLKVNYRHPESDFIDFNIQKLLMHKFSEYGPGLASGDIDGNGLDDIVVGASVGNAEQVFLQQPGGAFTQRPLLGASQAVKSDDLGILLFDADNDNDKDVYIASGGYEHEANTDAYHDRFYINDGKGNFLQAADAIPKNATSKSCVRAEDFDKDGDLDLFVAGRVLPGQYPKPVSSFIYRNETKDGIVKFSDVTNAVAKSLDSIGLVCDALWTDFDNDGWTDLILAGEWMPITILKNENGSFRNFTEEAGIGKQLGWWSSIAAGDFDNDGDIDYMVGNLGLNSYYRASAQNPARIYAKDFDKNGSYDAIPSLYIPATADDPVKKEFPAQTRDDIIKQLVSFRSKFQTYKSFAEATFDKLFTPEEFKNALILEANNFNHSYLKNLGDGKFQLANLPEITQYSCINGMLAEDFDSDGNLDLLITGNDYGTEVSVGRYDGCNGVFMKGNGKGDFAPAPIIKSGWYVPGNAKALVKLRGSNGQLLLAASQNRGALKLSRLNQQCIFIPALPYETSVFIEYADGKKQKQELNYGASFLSQSARFVILTSPAKRVELVNTKGVKRIINLN
jgi:ASPIC and UnbV/FG-GAP-like repeat